MAALIQQPLTSSCSNDDVSSMLDYLLSYALTFSVTIPLLAWGSSTSISEFASNRVNCKNQASASLVKYHTVEASQGSHNHLYPHIYHLHWN